MIKTLWQMMWSIPLCLAWIIMYVLLNIYGGTKLGDKFIMYWTEMVMSDLELGMDP